MSVAAHKEHQHQNVSSLDWFGLGLSTLCAVHCIALPLLAGLAPVLEVVDQGGAFHWIMAVLIVPLGVFAFWRGYRQHRRPWVIAIGLVGLLLVVSGLIAAIDEGHTHRAGTILTLAGSVILMLTHYQNWRLSRCQSCHPEHSHE